MNNKIKLLATVLMLTVVVIIGNVIADTSSNSSVEMNLRSRLCHDAYSPWYGRMKYFLSFDSMSDCLKVGKRRAY